MSKSLGNVVDRQDIVKGEVKTPAYGVDALRWWVASHAVQHAQVPVTENTFKDSHGSVQKLRLILRFLLGNLNGYNPKRSSKKYWLLDRYMLRQLHFFNDEVQSNYQRMQISGVCASVLNFVANDVSALYVHLTKDRLYCEAVDSAAREACQDVCFNILEFLLRAIAPVVPHLTEETYMYHPLYAKKCSYFRSPRIEPSKEWNNDEIANLMKILLNIKEEIIRLNPTNVRPVMLSVDLQLSSSLQEILMPYSEAELLEILQVADFRVVSECSEDFKVINVERTFNLACHRCRRYLCAENEELCLRCSDVVL